MFEFIGSLSESRLFPSVASLEKAYGQQDLCETLYLLILSMRIALAEDDTASWARSYLRRSNHDHFTRWRTDGTDLYICAHALKENILGDSAIAFDFHLLEAWMAHAIRDDDNEALTKRLFARMDYWLRIKDGSMKAMRRMVADWPHQDHYDRSLVMTRLLQMLRNRVGKAEVLPYMVRLANHHGLELDDVCNLETGDNCDDTDTAPKKAKEKSSFGSGLMRALAGAGGFAAGYALTKPRKVKEDATAGATAASSIATVVKPFGAVIRRPSIAKTSLKEITRPQTREDAVEALKAAGYAVIGQGSSGTVLQKPGQTGVLKLFSTHDAAYQEFLMLALEHQSNPHFPKVKGPAIEVTPEYQAIRMEHLLPADSFDVRHIRAYMMGEDHPRYADALAFLEDEPDLKQACDLVMSLGYELDLSPRNFMWRSGVLVITDPVSNEYED